jgi:ATP/ADP translocase
MTKEGVLRLMNVRESESPVVFRLLAIQFFLGLATAFLISASYSLFLYTYPVTKAPEVFMLSALVLFPLNAIYARADLKFNSKKLLQGTILFAAASLAITLAFYEITHLKWLVIVIAAWNISLYMIIGYAYWGLAAMLFNVRESRRIFSVIGAGDLPAKAIGYIVVSVFAHSLGLDVIMGASIIFFIIAFYLCKKLFAHSAIDWAKYEPELHHTEHEKISSWWNRLFENKLIQWIAVLSIISYLVLYLFDYTFLSQIKVRFHSQHELATFISLFFASGRLLAIVVKLVFSSRLIARLGLARSLLFTPILLLLVSACVFSIPLFKLYQFSYLYAFGVLVLISEVLRSTIQEPVFFILFQPLSLHTRLKGHLVAKGYVLPPALVIVSLGIAYWLYAYQTVSISGVLLVASILFLLWMAAVFKVDKEYIKAVEHSIQRGFFTGVALFLNDDKVIKTLLEKIQFGNTTEKLHALYLLEKSEYKQLEKLFVNLLKTGDDELKVYVLGRIEAGNYPALAKNIEEFYHSCDDPALKLAAYQTACMIDNNFFNTEIVTWAKADFEKQRALLVCVSKKQKHKHESTLPGIEAALQKMAGSQQASEQLKLLEILEVASLPSAELLLRTMQASEMPAAVFKKWLDIAGRLQLLPLLPTILKAFENRETHTAAAGALLHMKEPVFESPLIENITNSQVLVQLTAIAAKTHSKAAADFLLKLLAQKQIALPVIIDALWQQQYMADDAGEPVLQTATTLLIDNLTLKYELYLRVEPKQHQLLANAINSEIETGLLALLQLLAIQYGKKQLTRVIELVEMKQFHKIHNAIELLELSIPRKIFNPVVELVDHITGDPGKIIRANQRHTFAEIAETVLTNSKNFNDWTKSVIWWLAGQENDKSLVAGLAAFKHTSESQIVTETKEFVISSLQ